MTLTFAYSGGEGHDISVQWFHNGILLVDGTYGDTEISGAQTTILTITEPTSDYSGDYYARVIDLTVQCIVQTDTYVVTIPGTCTLVLVTQPAGVSVTSGDNVELSFAYTGGSGNVSIQWYRNDVALEDGVSGGSTIAGATTTTLSITSIEAALDGNYYAIITDNNVLDCGAQTVTAIVTVNAPECDVVIDTQPIGGSYFIGDEVDLSFAYSGGTGPYTIQWYLDGVALVDGPAGDATISGATTTALTITNAQAAQTGLFTAIVTDTNGCTAQTDGAAVTVEAPAPPAGMHWWYKADADAECCYADGTLALPMNDYSGNNMPIWFTGNPAPHKEPHIVYNAQNGLAVWNWNEGANNDNRGFPPLLTNTGLTIALVIRKHHTGYSIGLPNFSFNVVNSTTITLPKAFIYGYRTASLTEFTWQFTTDMPGSSFVNLTGQYDTWYVITATIDFTEGIARMKLNDTEGAGAATPFSTVWDVLGVSVLPTDRIAEIIVYNYKLSDSDLTQVREYLSDKWNIPITV